MDLGFTALVFLLTVIATMLFSALSSSAGSKKKFRLTTAHVLIAFVAIVGALIWGIAYYSRPAVSLAQEYTQKLLPAPKNGDTSSSSGFFPNRIDGVMNRHKATLKTGEDMNRSLQDAANQIGR